ncbi:related to Phosphatidylinositol 4,5-bisphosphate-binding protein SLM2 [Hanseniaspora guilliermondii]|uniref:Related to Phosphatidylinositol 4,5-bisphosphate-binding protein SLM2 n=1 Tax=Hanseniaspora guilliermondii TaxID=56406 RepID=A0A1L0AWE6_9ASCO|nr:related to Phosphatidylinositol 4,5-bisphosphate-binding protein SLM2 [Hanseniaspora guilliermondii]
MNSINQDNQTIMTQQTGHTQNTEHTYLSSTTNGGATMSLHTNSAAAQYKEVLKQPLAITVPYNLQPTEILAQRFTCWKAIIKAVLVYLQETCSIQDEIVRQQIRLSHAINFPFQNLLPTANALSEKKSAEGNGIHKDKGKNGGKLESLVMGKLFAPSGNNSVVDLPQVLAEYHSSMIQAAQYASRELNNTIIPRLVDLRRDLQVKIKEIKELESDFANSLDSQLNNTKKELQQYSQALEQAKYSTNNKLDPYLCKLTLDRSIKRQLHEENFLHEAYLNLQTSGGELEKVIIHEIQNALTQYAKLMGQEAQLVFDTIISKLDSGFLNVDPAMEWSYYTESSVNKDCFIPLDLPMRHFSKITYKSQFDPLANELLSGFLEKRSKFLKSYTRGFYLLTPTFLHEFKTGDRKKDVIPIMSLSLNDCTVAEHSKRGSSEYKFVLHAKQNGLIHRGQNWVFRCDSYDTMFKWFDIMKKLTSTTDPKVRSKIVCEYLNLDLETGKNLNKVMKRTASPPLSTSQRSVLSNESKVVSKSAKNNLKIGTSPEGGKTSNAAILPNRPITPIQQFHNMNIDDNVMSPEKPPESMSESSANVGPYSDHPYGGNSEYDDSIVMNGYGDKWD